MPEYMAFSLHLTRQVYLNKQTTKIDNQQHSPPRKTSHNNARPTNMQNLEATRQGTVTLDVGPYYNGGGVCCITEARKLTATKVHVKAVHLTRSMQPPNSQEPQRYYPEQAFTWLRSSKKITP